MTILAAIVIGTVSALLMGWMMPVNQDGLTGRIAVGVVAAILACIATIAWTGGSVLAFDARSSMMALIGSLYALFAYQCLAMRRQ